jgi:uncharacterized Tic20 family protein
MSSENPWEGTAAEPYASSEMTRPGGEPPGGQPPGADPGMGGTGAPTSDDRTWAMLAHLSGFILPIIGPLLVMAVRRSESGFVESHSKEALNMHITYTIVFLVLGGLTALTIGIGIICTGPAMMVAGLAYLVIMIQATIRANEGQLYRYPYVWRLIT